MTRLRLALLGPPVVERDGLPVTFDTRKAIALLAVLAVTGREHSRERLADLLWPDADVARARGSLRRTLSVTAAEVGPALTITRSTVALTPGMVSVDVTEFADLIARPDVASLQRAARLYRDDFLAGFALRDCAVFDDWQAAEAERLRLQLARALQRLVASCTEAGELDRALEYARRWLLLDQLHEPAHQAVIRLLGWTGQRSTALRQYRSLVQVLDQELAVRPLPATTQLYEQVRADQLDAPPVGSAGAALAGAGSTGGRPAGNHEAHEPLHPVQAGQPEHHGQDASTAAQPAAAAWPLVGRAAELDLLTGAWRSAGPGGQAVAVVGEAGSGKTRLIGELSAAAAAAGSAVVVGRCHDGEETLPFVLAADLLRGCLAATPDLPESLPAATAALVGRLVPSLAAAHADLVSPALDSPLAVTRMYAAIAETLTAAAGPGWGGSESGLAGIVIIEDAHWADASSLDLLGYLVRRLTELPFLLVLSWRPEYAARLRALRVAIGEQAASGRALLLTPSALTVSQLQVLLAAAGTPQVDATRLLAETRGLPLLVHEYVQAMQSAAAGQQDSGTESGWWPTGSVRELLRDRLLAVSEPTLQVLTAAAVLRSNCDAEMLRVVSGRGEEEIVEAIDEALVRLLLSEVAPSGQQSAPEYGFPYDALRRTVYETASLARRRLLHSRAADALARRYDKDAVPAAAAGAAIAEHLQRAGRDAAAADWWWLAARHARDLYAHADAHAHLTKALALGYPQVPGRLALGEVLIVLGRYTEALGEFETAAAAAGGDRRTLATIEHKLAEVQHRLGNWELADAHLSAVQDLLSDAQPGMQARAFADHAVVRYRLGDVGAAADLGRAALAAATKAADAGATAQAQNVLGMVAASEGQAERAERYLRESLAAARRGPDLGTAVAALNNLARLLADMGRPAEALKAAEDALAVGQELGDQHRLAALHTNLADLLHAAGQRDAAVAHLKEAARRFAAVDAGDAPRPEIWTLVEW
jgi:DNA-binding SARP family transcriptional activator/RecA/RadA recombinase